MPIVRATVRIDAQFSTGVWTSLRDDLSSAEVMSWSRGMSGGGARDTVATTGTCEFGLKNDAQSGGPRLQGWYSPNHTNVRSGWTFGIPIRVVVTYDSTDYTVWRGKLRAIDPIPGQYGPQRVRCVAHDFMGDLAEAEVNVAIQIDQTEVECLQAIVAALPADSAPAATSYDTALETFPFGLDNMADGVRAATGAIDVIDSCQGRLYVAKDGTFTYTNRQTWSTVASDFTFTEAMLDRDGGIEVPSDLEGVTNDVSAAAHPKTVTASIVLCGIEGAVFVGAGQTIEVWLDYRDPNGKDRLIGGKNFSPLVEDTDYDARANADGTGSDLSGDLSVSVSPFAARAKFTVANNGATGAYLVNGSGTHLLQMRGEGLFDNAPDIRRSTSTQAYGTRKLPRIDLRYQADGGFAADVAAFTRARFESVEDVDAIAFDPQRSDALMTEALTAEIGQVKTVSETMTGLSAKEVMVQGIEMEVTKGDYLRVRYITAPASPFKMWQLGTAGVSELGESTTLGF